MAAKKTKKVDLFQASREMSDRVADYMRIRVYNVTIQTRLRAKLREIDQRIENTPKVLEGSAFGDEVLAELKERLTQQRNDIIAEYDKLREEADAFELTMHDKQLYAAYKNGQDLTASVKAWFKAYNLDVTDTAFLREMVGVISGRKQAGAATIVRSGATQFTALRSKKDVVCTLYATLAEKMLEAGTLKPEQLPQDVIDFYPVKKSK